MAVYNVLKEVLTNGFRELTSIFSSAFSSKPSARIAFNSKKLTDSSESQPAYKEHMHPEYVRKDAPAFFTSNLNGVPGSRFAKAKHEHETYVKSDSGNLKFVERAETFQGRFIQSFAHRFHSHPYQPKHFAQGKAIADESVGVELNKVVVPPQALYSLKDHKHGERYVKRQTRAPLTARLIVTGINTMQRAFSYFAKKYHRHPELLSDASGYKPKVKEIAETSKINKLKLTLYRYTLSAESTIKNVAFKVLSAVPTGWLPEGVFPQFFNSSYQLTTNMSTKKYGSCSETEYYPTPSSFATTRTRVDEMIRIITSNFCEHQIVHSYVIYNPQQGRVETYDAAVMSSPEFVIRKYIDYAWRTEYVLRIPNMQWLISWVSPEQFKQLQQKLERGQLVADAGQIVNADRPVRFFSRIEDSNMEGQNALNMLSVDANGKYISYPPYGKYWMPILQPKRSATNFLDLLVVMADTIIYYITSLLLTLLFILTGIYNRIIGSIVGMLVDIAKLFVEIADTLPEVIIPLVCFSPRPMIANLGTTVYNTAMDVLKMMLMPQGAVTFPAGSPIAVPVIFKRVLWYPPVQTIGGWLRVINFSDPADIELLRNPFYGQIHGAYTVAHGFQTVVAQAKIDVQRPINCFISPISQKSSSYSTITGQLEAYANAFSFRHFPVVVYNTDPSALVNLPANLGQAIPDTNSKLVVLRSARPLSGPEVGFGVVIQSDGIIVRSTGVPFCALVATRQ